VEVDTEAEATADHREGVRLLLRESRREKRAKRRRFFLEPHDAGDAKFLSYSDKTGQGTETRIMSEPKLESKKTLTMRFHGKRSCGCCTEGGSRGKKSRQVSHNHRPKKKKKCAGLEIPDNQ